MFAKFFIDRPIFAWVIALIILLAGDIGIAQPAGFPIPVGCATGIVHYGQLSGRFGAGGRRNSGGIGRAGNERHRASALHGIVLRAGNRQHHADLRGGHESGLPLRSKRRTASSAPRHACRIDVRRLGVTVTKSARNYLMFVALFSPDKSLDNVALGSFAAANVLDSIRRVPGVGEAMLFGTEYSMRLWLKPDKLQFYNLSPADVANAVRAQNTELAIGELGQLPSAPGQQFNAVIVTQSRLSTPEEFGNIIVRANPDGSTVRVKDVARVELGAQDYSMAARIDGQPTAAIAIRLTPGANALDTAKAVKAKMTELSKFFPKGISWVVPYDTSKFIEISIREMVKTLTEAMLLVFLVMYLFLGNCVRR